MNNQSIRYGLIGFSGRMGIEITKLFLEFGHNCVFKINTQCEEFLSNQKVDVLIDFSSKDMLFNSIKLAKKFNSPLIIGTTGLDANQIQLLRDLSNSIPVVQSYNFSTGIQLLLKLVEFVRGYTLDWDTEIIESHHIFKKDKPSGTALMIKEKIEKDIPISSMRIGGILGDHKVFFGNLGEILEISHRVLSRRAFAEGVLNSALFVMGRKNGFFSYSDVLFSGKEV